MPPVQQCSKLHNIFHAQNERFHPSLVQLCDWIYSCCHSTLAKRITATPIRLITAVSTFEGHCVHDQNGSTIGTGTPTAPLEDVRRIQVVECWLLLVGDERQSLSAVACHLYIVPIPIATRSTA